MTATSADLTHYVLSLEENTNRHIYTEQTIKGIIRKGGSNNNNFPLSSYVKYAYTLLTRAASELYGAIGTIKACDRITDQDNNTYEVLHVDKEMVLNQIEFYVCELMKLNRTYGGEARIYDLSRRDTTTGWLIPERISQSGIKLNFSNAGNSQIKTPMGLYGKYDVIAVTSDLFVQEDDEYDAIAEGDLLYGYDGYPWVVTASVPYPTEEESDFKVLYLTKAESPWRPQSDSVNWHLDSQSVTTDPRHRIKVWLDTYLSNIIVSSSPSIIYANKTVLFSGMDYPLTKEFVDNDKSILFIVDKTDATPRLDYTRKPYAFEENIPIKICTISGQSSDETATRLVETALQDITDIAVKYPLGVGTFRQISTVKHGSEWIGLMQFWSTTVNISYLRPNTDYTNSGVTVTWGPSATPTGTFTFPNITRLRKRGLSNNARLTAPGRLGSITQKLGLPDFIIEISCDLELGDWLRPQNGVDGSKTDKIPEQVFQDIRFNGQLSGQTYQSLNLGYGASIPVILDTVDVEETADGKTLELVFYGYNSNTLTNYKAELGISP